MTQATFGVLRDLTWQERAFAAACGGVLGGFLMGTLFHYTLIIDRIGALYGATGEATTMVGWIAHLGHSVVLAVLFGTVSSVPGVTERLERLSERAPSQFGPAVVFTAGGTTYGLVVWLFGWSGAFPYLLELQGTATFAPETGGFLLHLLYAVPMAVGFLSVARLLSPVDTQPDPTVEPA